MGSKNSGGSSTTTTNPWGPAQGALESILGQAGELFDKQGGINTEWLDKEIADLNPGLQQTIKDMVNTDGFKKMADNITNATQQGMSGIGQATGMLGGLAQTGITADDINKMAGELYDTKLVGSQKESLGKELEKGLNKKVQGINQSATASGSMGSSRAGVAEGVAIGDTAEAYATGAAGIENAARASAQGQALQTLTGNQQTALGAAGAMGNLGIGSGNLQIGGMNSLLGAQQGALGAGSLLQDYNQNILNNKWFNQQGQQNIGWDQLNKYLGIAGSIGSMGGTSNTTQQQGSGNMFGQLLGAGATIGGAFLKSDRRLKNNIELVKPAHTRINQDGKEYQVPNLYKWEWNDLAFNLFIEHGENNIPPAYGVIAQELEETGFEDFVTDVETGVEGLDGSVKLVNYVALMLYVGLEEEEEGV
ncbi:MAG: tail fiber domain-containing protein [Fusobacteriaceae bacterium]